jgi:hypothetical protein
LKNPLVAKRVFRYEDDVGLACDAGPQCQVSCVPSHHFHDLNPTVRAGRRAGSFDYFRHVAKGGVEPQRIVSARDVFIDCLGDSDHSDPGLSDPGSDTESVLSAADYDRIKPEGCKVFDYFAGTILKAAILPRLPERIRSRRTEVGSTISIPPPHSLAA